MFCSTVQVQGEVMSLFPGVGIAQALKVLPSTSTQSNTGTPTCVSLLMLEDHKDLNFGKQMIF